MPQSGIMEVRVNILQEIAAKRQIDTEKRKEHISLETIREQALRLAGEEKEGKGEFSFPFEKSLSGPGMHFICEVKKASPSKGIIAEEFPYLEIAGKYERAGASAISVLTEPEYFLGKDEYLQKIAKEVAVPVLRKDFTVDAYQIYEAKVLGASAVLLICTLLPQARLQEFLKLAHSLGLSALVETHDEEEVKRALEAGARVVGVNNRDLKTFQVDIQTSLRLREKVPAELIFVSESGIRNRKDIQALEDKGVNAVLIGETLMKSPDKKKQLHELKGGGYA